jgi:histidyl-tRNA synthetase
MERVALLLGTATDHPAAFVVLVPLGEPALARCLGLAGDLRLAGVSAEVAYGGRRLRVELERANRLRAPYVLILGENELTAGLATVRNMASGQQQPVALAEVVGHLVRVQAGPHP